MTDFSKLAAELNARSESDVLVGFNLEFQFTGYDGVRYYVAEWLVEDILSDDIEFMSQEFFEEVFEMYDEVMQDENYFGGEFPFIRSGEVI